jgi:hypothetical protein
MLKDEPNFETINQIVKGNSFVDNPYINELFEEHKNVREISFYV